MKLTASQGQALKTLNKNENVFLTGAAGTGKSFLLKKYVQEVLESGKNVNLLASTGAAAVLIGGRTFHSFFGLGRLQGSEESIIEKAATDRNVGYRVRKVDVIIVDEVSMLTGQALHIAESIAREARTCDEPWGGIRMVVVGDFAQLPPISIGQQYRDWAFMHPVWTKSNFEPVHLTEVVRTQDEFFLQQLHQIRKGECDVNVEEFLNSRMISSEEKEVTQLFGRRNLVERYNQDKLEGIKGKLHVFETQFKGESHYTQALIRSMPIPQTLHLKLGALVMIRINDPKLRYVNGTLGTVASIEKEQIGVDVKGRRYYFEPLQFAWMNGEGEVKASGKNYPLCLAWASTIHKIQGATVSNVNVNLKQLWEPGQAYVALSRVERGENIFLKDWERKSIRCDPLVHEFYKQQCPSDFGREFDSF